MRTLLITLILLSSFAVRAQELKNLQPFSHYNYPKQAKYKAFIYGSIQRSMFDTSSIISDEVWLYNEEKKEIWSFKIKPRRGKEIKDNKYCYSLPPGRYGVIAFSCNRNNLGRGKFRLLDGWVSLNTERYTWWLGEDGKWSDRSRRYITRKRIHPLPKPYYYIEVEEGKVHYLGKWYVAPEGIYFRDDKQKADWYMEENVPNLNFKDAVVALPAPL